MREPRTPMPMFYYCGSKHHGIKSDAIGIEFHLLRLPDHLREGACQEYSVIYQRHLYGKHPFDRRSMANGWLTKYCDENGVSVEKMREKLFGTKVSDSNKNKVNCLVGKIKKISREKRKRIIL
ncbi:hypothetical protein vBVpPvVp04M_00018 [Vibrio phage vB_Vp_PvVp04_M]|nr:hypothetical protein vBVpPvVp04M_00018 [Vibrio phage vB_Vp_PvVp04_M]